MCLIRKEGYEFGVVKDKPIEAYKVLIERDGVLTSPVMEFKYEIGKIYEDMLGAISTRTFRRIPMSTAVGEFPVYDRGFHTISTIDGAILYSNFIKKYVELQDDARFRTSPTFLVIVKCLVPPVNDNFSTIYATGEDSDYSIPGIVSNRMQIVEIVSKTPIESRRKAPNLKPFES